MPTFAVTVELLSNVTLLLALTFLAGLMEPWLERLRPVERQIVDGALFGAFAVLNMLHPVYAYEGIFFDLRSVMIAIASFYGGLTSGLTAALMVIGYRLSLGGLGAGGAVFAALTAALVGALLRECRHRHPNFPLLPQFILLGLGMALQTLLWIALMLPADIALTVLTTFAAPNLIALPLGMCLLGGIIEYQRRNFEIAAALKHERNLLRTLIDNVPDYIFVKNTSGRFMLSNIAHAKAAGVVNPDLLVGKTAADCFPPELAAQYEADDRAVIDEGRMITTERRTVNSAGSPIWVTTIKVPLRDEKGVLMGVIGISRDITERKLAEEGLQKSETRFRQMVLAAGEGIWMIGVDHRTQFVNPRMAQMLGYSVDEMMGKPIRDFLYEADFETSDQYLQRRKRGLTDQYDFKLKRKDGSDLWVIISSAPIFNSDGEYESVLAMVTDISERKQIEAQETQLAIERHRFRGLKKLIVNISHDFRTPLTTLNTSFYLLRKIEDPAQREERLRVMEEQISRIERLLKGFQEVSELDRYDLPPTLRLIELNRIVQKVIKDEGDAAKGKGLILQFNPAPGLTPVMGAPDELAKAISKVVENAITFTPKGGCIEIETYETDSEVVVRIQDNGVGISGQDMPHIFEHFYRADPARSSQTGGAGLGLTIARQIIKHHSGRIEVESEPERGSTFYIYLPRPIRQRLESRNDE